MPYPDRVQRLIKITQKERGDKAELLARQALDALIGDGIISHWKATPQEDAFEGTDEWVMDQNGVTHPMGFVSSRTGIRKDHSKRPHILHLLVSPGDDLVAIQRQIIQLLRTKI